MKRWLDRIRKPKSIGTAQFWMHACSFILLGSLLGLMAKMLDQIPSNTLPSLLMSLDLRNVFSRLTVWMVISLMIALYTKSPMRAGVYVGLFYISSLVAYYVYTVQVAGFMPRAAMLYWFVIALTTPIFAWVCWYAKGDGLVSKMIAVFIFIGVSRQVFAFGLWYLDLAYPIEFILWLMMLVGLHQSNKQIMHVLGFGVLGFVVLMPISLIFGIF